MDLVSLAPDCQREAGWTVFHLFDAICFAYHIAPSALQQSRLAPHLAQRRGGPSGRRRVCYLLYAMAPDQGRSERRDIQEIMDGFAAESFFKVVMDSTEYD